MPEVRVLDAAGKQIGVLKTADAIKMALEQGLDLVEVAGTATPPVAKIVDFKKFKYEEAKRERVAKRKTHEISTKEIWLGPLIGSHDLDNRLRRAIEFLETGDRVKLTVKFSGREMAHQEFGHQVLAKAKEILNEKGVADGTPRMLGRNLSLSFSPVKK